MCSPRPGRREQHLAVGAPVVLGGFDADRVEALLDRAGALVGGEDPLPGATSSRAVACIVSVLIVPPVRDRPRMAGHADRERPHTRLAGRTREASVARYPRSTGYSSSTTGSARRLAIYAWSSSSTAAIDSGVLVGLEQLLPPAVRARGGLLARRPADHVVKSCVMNSGEMCCHSREMVHRVLRRRATSRLGRAPGQGLERELLLAEADAGLAGT